MSQTLWSHWRVFFCHPDKEIRRKRRGRGNCIYMSDSWCRRFTVSDAAAVLIWSFPTGRSSRLPSSEWESCKSSCVRLLHPGRFQPLYIFFTWYTNEPTSSCCTTDTVKFLDDTATLSSAFGTVRPEPCRNRALKTRCDGDGFILL